MSTKPRARPVSDPINAYYATLKDFAHQYALHEGAVSTAFQTLLSERGKKARPHKWTLIPQLGEKYVGKDVRPDGTFKDEMHLVRGHWEAKDTSDDLDSEIAKKIKRGYPLKNIIFEDTRIGVLIQNRQEVMRVDLRDPVQLDRLLETFFAYTEPQIENFEHAVDEFQERVPDLAKHLAEKIAEAHQTNKKFQIAFDAFFKLCQTALNPNISTTAVDEMLIQHLLTERLIREVFDNPEFTRRNVIAAEVEKVIDALTSKSFNRDTFLKSLDRFYKAIENAARTMPEFNDKQHFLNTVYERFFQGYSVKLADTHGIVYTPQPIVDFMCASVAEVLEKEFGKTLGDKDVFILDPCTGTGNFIVNLVKRIAKRDLPRVYREQLFANEVMLLPYYIAALNIEHAYYEQTGEYDGFEGLCFVDTLDMAEHQQAQLDFMTAKNAERVERQKRTPITVIIGNPPYNTGQLHENDDNRNRKYPVVDRRIGETYVADSQATLRKQLYDPYVRFFRWATDRLEGRPGIVCLVTNNSFVEQFAFGGMRRHLLRDFSAIYHVDLQGNVRHNPKLSGSAYNVFGIQVGVGITVAVRTASPRNPSLRYAQVDEQARRHDKLAWLQKHKSVAGIPWNTLTPDERSNWLSIEHGGEFSHFSPIGAKERSGKSAAVFSEYSNGVKTNSDVYVYAFARSELQRRAERMIEDFNTALDRWRRHGRPEQPESVLQVDERVNKWIRNTKRTLQRDNYLRLDETNIREGLYRPFTKQWYFFNRAFNEDTYGWRRFLPPTAPAAENVSICVSAAASERPFYSIVTNCIPNLAIVGFGGACQCFPFYVYDEDGSNRRENVTDWALGHFR